MNQENLLKSYWEDIVSMAVLLLNLYPTASRTNQSPQFLWTNTLLKLERLRTFGFREVIHNLKQQYKVKMEPPGQPGILIGYNNINTDYDIVQRSDSKVSVTHHATFNKNVFPILPSKIENSFSP
ncbi:hypothetical protein O181_003767 [Austropuccinia psidii MF-1]|uniref:Retroviral polymerase SH3-like domain-containing protein n=1 Tax=Austropuccinia psidii MF-1 TaxID=1389203 RepID=A0A9Q3GF66_9BASI|nr:hypothetical protein [Austropuccinia psidii MF-1]